MEALIPFVTIYLGESGFLTLVNIKTKNRNRLDIQHDMHVALSHSSYATTAFTLMSLKSKI
jgi:hypothetical protein